jgi:NADH dehydrogenase
MSMTFEGFTGVLKNLQKEFHNDSSVEITLVSKDNFLLFTPMLPKVASGMIETRHIVTPVRSFCRKAKFYEANLESIDLDNKRVMIIHTIGRQPKPISSDSHEHALKYDYLVIALGSEDNFFGMSDLEENAISFSSSSPFSSFHFSFSAATSITMKMVYAVFLFSLMELFLIY